MNNREFSSLLEIMNRLRKECPWDNKQTFDSLKSGTIEECYELIDAIGNRDFSNIKEELGDVLLHVVFYSKMADEQGFFTIDDVIEGINEKLIRRHPHVFGTTEVSGTEDVVRNWEEIKKSERKEQKEHKGTLSGVPSALPSLIKAYRIQQKAASVGFDWEKAHDVLSKIKEEIEEFEVEVNLADKKKMEEEMGDVIFSLINCARKFGIDPENALELTNRKFISRFNFIEENCNGNINSLTLAEMETLWQKAKNVEKENGTN
ncbi:MAG: nucleoside triphosphate pyrophosphohydrolase [Rikenellaceae bacterium]